MALIGEIVVAALIVIGGFFLFVGSYGLTRLPDTMQRLHSPTKATTLGIGSLLIASMLFFLTARGELSIHELLITIFMFLTAPVSANMISKACILRERKVQDELSDPSPGTGWATFGAPGDSAAGR